MKLVDYGCTPSHIYDGKCAQQTWVGEGWPRYCWGHEFLPLLRQTLTHNIWGYYLIALSSYFSYVFFFIYVSVIFIVINYLNSKRHWTKWLCKYFDSTCEVTDCGCTNLGIWIQRKMRFSVSRLLLCFCHNLKQN